MKLSETLHEKADLRVEQILDYLARLSFRERIMVVVASIIMVVALVGAALWKMHSAAESEQKRLNELKDTLVWMQSNVVTMKPANDLNLSSSEKIQRVAQQQGISVASQEMGKQTQVVAQHENYAILANVLTQMAQMGLSIEQLELIKVDGQIKLTATVQ